MTAVQRGFTRSGTGLIFLTKQLLAFIDEVLQLARRVAGSKIYGRQYPVEKQRIMSLSGYLADLVI